MERHMIVLVRQAEQFAKSKATSTTGVSKADNSCLIEARIPDQQCRMAKRSQENKSMCTHIEVMQGMMRRYANTVCWAHLTNSISFCLHGHNLLLHALKSCQAALGAAL